MKALIKKTHTYLGLLNFTVLLIFGIAGLMITFSRSPEERKRPQPEAQFREFKVPPNIDDETLARVREAAAHEVLHAGREMKFHFVGYISFDTSPVDQPR